MLIHPAHGSECGRDDEFADVNGSLCVSFSFNDVCVNAFALGSEALAKLLLKCSVLFLVVDEHRLNKSDHLEKHNLTFVQFVEHAEIVCYNYFCNVLKTSKQ